MGPILTTLGIAICFIGYCSTDYSAYPGQIPPDHAFVNGVILSVFSNSNDNTSCKQGTCWAFVQITSINGYGSGFRGALNVDDTIELKFSMSLLPTEEFPGLSVNESFEGNIRQQLSGLSPTSKTSFQIDHYRKY